MRHAAYWFAIRQGLRSHCLGHNMNLVLSLTASGRHAGEKRAARGGKGSDACAACGGKYGAEGEPEDTLWVGCDTCDCWYHGACVGATQARLLKSLRYQCLCACRRRGCQ